MEDVSRLAPECGLVGRRPQQWGLDRGQTERGLKQRQARQYAKRGRLGRSQPGVRLLVLGAVVREERFWGGGPNRSQPDGQGGRERSDGQENA